MKGSSLDLAYLSVCSNFKVVYLEASTYLLISSILFVSLGLIFKSLKDSDDLLKSFNLDVSTFATLVSNLSILNLIKLL